MTTRASISDPWTEAVNLGPIVNSSAWDGGPSISPDGLSLFFFSERPGGSGGKDLWVTTRIRVSEPWGTPVNLGPTVNSSSEDATPDISADGLALFFFSTRSGGYGNYDLWVTTRTTLSSPWGSPVNLGPTINSSTFDFSPNISADGSTLYFNSGRSGGLGGDDIWQVAINPIVDFSGDGIVDAVDMCIMVNHWHTNSTLCDIAPLPLGDNFVDMKDLTALAEHLFEEVIDPTLIAHWPLDETEGMIVTDSTGNNDGYALGDPIWQPESGQVNGALHLDGVDDYVVTGAAPNPEGEAYSVLAWIKGGAAGQVVLSQMGKANWLSTDQSGTLMTELTCAGRNSRSLASEIVITDDSWHRIGFVWDGSYRTLYVDSIVVAEDAQDNLDISSNGLYFGTGKSMESGTFFSGLIDDIRIYNRAVSP
jgi:hypothetical protein